MSTKNESNKPARAPGGGRVYYPKKGDEEKMGAALAKAFPKLIDAARADAARKEQP